MAVLTTCECIGELPLGEKLDQIFCALVSDDAGDATAANQVLEIAQLTAINGNTDALPAALGQAAMAASLPVVIASDQSSIPTKDNGPQWTPTRTYTAIAAATTTDITVAPTAGQKIVADDILISSDTAMGISIIEETSGTVFAKVYIPANGTVPITLRDGIKAAVADKKLRAITSAAGNVSITCCYHSEA